MRVLTGLLLLAGCGGIANASVFLTVCSDDDDGRVTKFSIESDTTKKIGVLTHFSSKKGPKTLTALKVISVARLAPLVRVTLLNSETRVRYIVEYVEANCPANSPYTKDMEGEATKRPDGTTSRYSCGLEE